MTAAPHTAPRAVCLLGPTASGKTAAALALAERWPVEIISMDSALVYRDMDIGTAKPSRAEQAIAPHHLIDIIDPLDAYSAAQFATDAQALIEAIRARGRLPLIVGGTMLYYKALTQGCPTCPAPTRPSAPRSTPRPRATAGRRCMRSSRRSIPSPRRGCMPPMPSASSAHWNCTG